jgi:hypothetical protein
MGPGDTLGEKENKKEERRLGYTYLWYRVHNLISLVNFQRTFWIKINIQIELPKGLIKSYTVRTYN